jgi:hypothetical protein
MRDGETLWTPPCYDGVAHKWQPYAVREYWIDTRTGGIGDGRPSFPEGFQGYRHEKRLERCVVCGMEREVSP